VHETAKKLFAQYVNFVVDITGVASPLDLC